MKADNPRVLLISSCSISQGPAAMAGQYYDALRSIGIETDLLLKYPEPNRPDILYVWKKDQSKSFLSRLIRKVLSFTKKKPLPGYYFFYKKENEPPVPTADIINKVTKPYNLVIVYFWQTMLSFESIEGIYDKLHCQIVFAGVDYSQMSGGCHFTGDCQRYKVGCGCCPAFCSNNPNDFTAWNVQYRKRVYDKVKPIVYGNQYMMEFYKESYLLKDVQSELGRGPIIDTEIFKPLEIQPIRRKYEISDDKRVLIFFASQKLTDERKGIKYLIDALNLLYERMAGEARQVLVLMAGREFEKVKNLIRFDVKGFGYVPMNSLPELFSMSRFYVCPSVNDAGPMMVCQSLSCGTPVVGFDMGYVKEFVKGQTTGVCVPLRNTQALAEGMERLINMDKMDYSFMSNKCRTIALNNFSYDSQAKSIIELYKKYQVIE